MRWLVSALLLLSVWSCGEPTTPAPRRGPQSVVLFATPKILPDFENPEAGAAQFLDHYEPLTSRASETILIFAVGNSEHILTYRGKQYWGDDVEWARWRDDGWIPVSWRTLNYHQIDRIVRAFRSHAAAKGIKLKVYDQMEKGREFAKSDFKWDRHRECFSRDWDSWDIRGRLTRDTRVFASAPNGIVEGTTCGKFLVDQTDHYLNDLGFDGVLYGNQLGTRGQWEPHFGPGYTDEEAAAIREFFRYSKQMYAEKEIMWFDTYNNLEVERKTWSVPSDAYENFDYLIASGFCVITTPERYLDNLKSKLSLKLRRGNRTRVLATLDYVDPWYTYDSMTEFPDESARLEQVAIENRDQIDGIVFFANDEFGVPVPREIVESFANRFFGPR